MLKQLNYTITTHNLSKSLAANSLGNICPSIT